MSDFWQPTATLANLQLRASIFAKIRAFFAERGVLEVETPLLCHSTATDLYIDSFTTCYQFDNRTYYLQTSPEFAMKRLLANGSGAIYQLSKAFRHEPNGHLHNPEFTMLEWYRPGFNHHDLMDEMDDLLHLVLKTPSAIRFSYAELFKHYLSLDPHGSDLTTLQNCAIQHHLDGLTDLQALNRDDWLNLLMTHYIEPRLSHERPIFIYDYPTSQAALARIRAEQPPVAERFEVYFRSIELANGYHELSDATEQQERFKRDIQMRQQRGYPTLPVDEKLLAALRQGFPDCAGVALGIDRLIQLVANAPSIADVISFAWERV
ncbi:MAG: EF-P lysine aminoacylase EpmA [Gammaproteobacteria bacterium]